MRAEAFYEYWEEKHGSLNAKSVHIMEEQRKIIKQLQEKYGITKLVADVLHI